MTTATATQPSTDKKIGEAPCPLHPQKAVPVKLSKNGLAYLVHAGCCQLFTRGDTADELLRGLMAAPVRAAKPEPEEAPAPASKVEVKPEVKKEADPWKIF